MCPPASKPVNTPSTMSLWPTRRRAMAARTRARSSRNCATARSTSGPPAPASPWGALSNFRTGSEIDIGSPRGAGRLRADELEIASYDVAAPGRDGARIERLLDGRLVIAVDVAIGRAREAALGGRLDHLRARGAGAILHSGLPRVAARLQRAALAQRRSALLVADAVAGAALRASRRRLA